MSRPTLRAASVVALFIAAGVAAYLLSGAIGIGGGELARGGARVDPVMTDPAQQPDGEDHVVTGTSGVGTFCVDALSVASVMANENALEEAVRANVLDAVGQGLQSPEWAPLNWSDATASVGCPTLPLPLTWGGEWMDGIPPGGPLPSVAKHTRYSLFVFVMSLEDMDSLLGGTERRRVVQEYQCDLDVCRPVETAIYVTPEEASDVGLLKDRIGEGLGLWLPR